MRTEGSAPGLWSHRPIWCPETGIMQDFPRSPPPPVPTTRGRRTREGQDRAATCSACCGGASMEREAGGAVQSVGCETEGAWGALEVTPRLKGNPGTGMG